MYLLAYLLWPLAFFKMVTGGGRACLSEMKSKDFFHYYVIGTAMLQQQIDCLLHYIWRQQQQGKQRSQSQGPRQCRTSYFYIYQNILLLMMMQVQVSHFPSFDATARRPRIYYFRLNYCMQLILCLVNPV